MIKLLVCCILLCLVVSAEGQLIDFSRIKQRKVRKLMTENHLSSQKDFNGLETACFAEGGGYSKNTKTFLVKARPDEVWDAYRNSSPKQCWGGKLVSFGVLFDSAEKPLVYADAPYGGMKAGQIIFIQLRLLKGLYKLAVAHKVVAIDDLHKSLQICYMKKGASEGSQFISLRETPEGFTEVTHETYYKSKSKFRDRRIYPGIHEKVISEYHANVARSVVHRELAGIEITP
ncbi:hypothetical protein [Leadbetterella sp. DM7]|uniref:hypothetical protein n=1 Tax=Leadbetterella sp. DM7 TaxID=3235085 RepID=UPI00349EA559